MGPRLQYFDMGRVHHGRKLPPGESASEEPKIFLEHFLSFISRGEVKSEFVSASFSPLLTPPSHLGRVFPSSPSLLHPSAVVSPGQQDWTDLVRADCCQDGHPLELLKRIKGRLDGAVPARKGEGQDTAGPASAEQDFAGEEPEAVGEDLAGGEPSAEDSPDIR